MFLYNYLCNGAHLPQLFSPYQKTKTWRKQQLMVFFPVLKTSMWQNSEWKWSVLRSHLNFQRTADFDFLNISKRENSWYGFFEKHQNQRITDPSYFKNLKTPVVFMKEPVVIWLVIWSFQLFWESWLYISIKSLIFWEPWLWILRTALITHSHMYVCSCF